MLTLAGLPGAQAGAGRPPPMAGKAAAAASMSHRRDPRKLYNRLELDGTIVGALAGLLLDVFLPALAVCARSTSLSPAS